MEPLMSQELFLSAQPKSVKDTFTRVLKGHIAVATAMFQNKNWVKY